MSSDFTRGEAALAPGGPPGPVVAILGVGLIGGTLGMAWRRAGACAEVIGTGPGPLDEALRLGAIDRAVSDPAAALAQADILVLAAPVLAICAQAEALAPHLRPGHIVTDVGSTKLEIVKAWERHLPPSVAFIGGHPMFGREVSGVANASPDLARGCTWVLTPSARSTPDAQSHVRRLAEATGARVTLMTAAEHDGRVAASSHLPQLVATALAVAAQDADDRIGGVLDLAASGMRDTTRLASSPLDLWRDILLTNPAAIRSALLIFRESLDVLERAVEKGDTAAVERIFARAHGTRAKLLRKG